MLQLQLNMRLDVNATQLTRFSDIAGRKMMMRIKELHGKLSLNLTMQMKMGYINYN